MENPYHIGHDTENDDVDVEVVLSESDLEWIPSREGESDQHTENETDSDDSYESEVGVYHGNSNDELSDYEEKYDIIMSANSDEDKQEIYIDRGMRGIPFVKEDDGKVRLNVDMLFKDVNHFRQVLKDYLIQEGFEVVRLKNEKARVTAKCAAEGCTWRIHASPTPDGTTYKIKTYHGEHTCIRRTKNGNATSTWIADKLKSKLVADPNMSYKSMNNELLEQFGLQASNNMQLYRARRMVKEDNKGTHATSYNRMPVWAKLAIETNPGSLIKLEVERGVNQNPQFKRFFVCLDAMKKGFVRGCRPWFGIDGCHLKGPYGGVLLAAVAIDANKGQYPLAFAVVEVECVSSWRFFLDLLHDALVSMPEWKEEPLIIMSDMQKGLHGAVADIFPRAMHRYCCNHLLNHFKQKCRGLLLTDQFWAIAKAHNEWLFDKNLSALRKINNDVAEWLVAVERPKEMWARHTINPACKSDHITNNICESFNSWVGDDRQKTILSMVESLTTRIMNRFQRRYEKACSQDHITGHRIMKVLNRNVQDGRLCKVSYAGDDEFQVKDGFTTFVVKLKESSCGCNVWNISGLPCKHAAACVAYKRADPEWYCHEYYTKRMYSTTYQELIHPMPELDDRNRGDWCTIDPPKMKRLPGRPRRARKRGADEGHGGKNHARRSSTTRCSYCMEFGHNKRGCQRDKTAKMKKQEMLQGGDDRADTSASQAHNASQCGSESQVLNASQSGSESQVLNASQVEN